MSANLTGFIAAALSVAAFAVAWGSTRHLEPRSRILLLLLFLVLSIPSVLVAAYYAGMPLEHAWYYEMRSWRGSEFFILPAGVAAAICATFLPRLLIALPLFCLLAGAVGPYLKPVLMPLADEDFMEEWKSGYCLQSTSSTCGPASASTIAKILGVDLTERETARAVHSYQNGTEAWYLARYLRSRGFKVRFDFREGFATDMDFPAVVGVKLGRIGHFIPVLEVRGDEVHTADPLQGGEWITQAECHRRYGFTGFHMTVSR